MTSESKNPPLWPFLIVDVLFVGLAYGIYQQAHRPLVWWEAWCLIICGAAGAWSLVTPFLQRSANTEARLQAEKLADVSEKIQKLEQLANLIGNSTAQWQIIQDTAAKTAQTATELAESMSAEAKAFTDFLQKANDVERTHLRLEVEKLRRTESEWLQITVRILDQVHALFQAAQASGNPSLSEQIGLFQNACREIPRRVGLTPVTATTGEPFDAKRHQLVDDAAAGADAVVLDAVVPGYSYQGQLIRRAVVRVQEPVKSNEAAG